MLVVWYIKGCMILVKFYCWLCQNVFLYELYHYSSTMEDAPTKPLNFQSQLQNLSAIQARIQQTKRSLNQLVKIDSAQAKQVETINRMYMITTRNKLNLFESHSLNQKKNRMNVEDTQTKQEKVKEMKEKAERELKQIRAQMKRNKQNERLVIKNNSIQYDEAIRKNRKIQIEKKQQLVKEIKQEKEKYKQLVMNSRIVEKQQKEVQLFNNTMAKIERQPSLAKELDKLMKQKEEVQGRLQERKQMKQKMKEHLEQLKKLKQQQFVTIVKQSHVVDLQKQKLSSGSSSLDPVIIKNVSSHLKLKTLQDK